jgi:hypothetical protein
LVVRERERTSTAVGSAHLFAKETTTTKAARRAKSKGTNSPGSETAVFSTEPKRFYD